MSYARAEEYTEPYDMYNPVSNYTEAYGPKNTPMVPAYVPPMVNPYFSNPFGYGQVRTGARVDPRYEANYVRGYDPEQLDKPIYEQWSEYILKGADSQLSTSTKSKRARNVNLLKKASSPESEWSSRQDFFLTPQ